MARKLRVGLLGYGTIGSGVVKLLTQSGLDVEKSIQLVRVADIELKKTRQVKVAPELLTTDTESVVKDPKIDVIVELIGGVKAAKKYVEMALDQGKDVVTANKYLMALHGDELYERAMKNGACLLFEASVAGGVPIIQVLREELAIDRIISINAILNGTCNYILTRMEQNPGMSCSEAVTEAQARGFAEADPTLDVSGMDTAQKISILVRKAFKTRIPPEKIDLQGITGVGSVDVKSAMEMGYKIKLLARASRQNDSLELWVGPALIPADSILAQVKNEFNAIAVDSENHHLQTFIGKGAGMMPTAGAVVADLFTLLSHRNIPSAFAGKRLDIPVLKRKDIKCRYYLRLTVKDQPGVLAKVSSALAGSNISIASVVQKENSLDPTRGVPLVITTHETSSGAMDEAVKLIDGYTDLILEPAHTLRIIDRL